MRVLVAYDGGEPGEKAMTAIAAWVHEHAADVHVVHVLNPKSIHETPRTTSLQPVMAAGTPNGTVLDAEGPFPVLAESRSQAVDAARTTATEEIAALATRRLGIYPVTPHVVVGTEAAHGDRQARRRHRRRYRRDGRPRTNWPLTCAPWERGGSCRAGVTRAGPSGRPERGVRTNDA